MHLQVFMLSADVDKNGALDLNEYLTWVSTHCTAPCFSSPESLWSPLTLWLPVTAGRHATHSRCSHSGHLYLLCVLRSSCTDMSPHCNHTVLISSRIGTQCVSQNTGVSSSSCVGHFRNGVNGRVGVTAADQYCVPMQQLTIIVCLCSC